MCSSLSFGTPLRWGRRFVLAALLLMAGPSLAQPPVFATPGLGVSVDQGGMAQPIQDFGAHYQVMLAPAPFYLRTRSDIIGDGVMLAIGLTPAVYDRFGNPSDPLFGPASAYARDTKQGPLFLTDPACQGDIPTGFNILWADQLETRGWPIAGILPDRAWVGCDAPSLDPQENLIRAGQTLYLVFSDGEGADFLTIVFDDGPSS